MNAKNYRLCISGLVVALYVVVMYITQSISFGQFQLRVATSIYSLAYVFDYLCMPLAFANMLSNLMIGSLGVWDTIGGFLIGFITTHLIRVLKKYNVNRWLCCLPIAIAPALIVPIWLHYILNLRYLLMVALLFPGQIVAYLIGESIIIPIALLTKNSISKNI